MQRRWLSLFAWFGMLVAGCSSDSSGVSGAAVVAGSGGLPSSGAGAAGNGAAGMSSVSSGAAGMSRPSGLQPSAAGANSGSRAGAPGANPAGSSGSRAAAGVGASSAGAAAVSGGAGAGAMSGGAGRAPGGGSGAAGQSGRGGTAAGSGAASAAGSGGTNTPGMTPLYRIPLRVHVAKSELTDAELGVILGEVNKIWTEQAGVCFEAEVTESETNRTDGFDFRYTSGTIPGASSANGLTENAHSIWSIDHPRLNDVMKPVMNPAARTTAHELGHALGLAHENPPPSTDCSSPCYCAQMGDDCDEYLMRSGTKGFYLSAPEIMIARGRAARNALSDQAATQCGAPAFMR